MFKSAARLLRDGAVSVGYPGDCHICGNSIQSWGDGVACSSCWEDPEITDLLISRHLCLRCGAPASRSSIAADCVLCEDLPVESARACGAYKGAIEASVLFLKSHPHIPSRLYDLMRSAFIASQAALASDLVVPVPLHRSRLNERGFNQADVVARAIGRISGLSIEYHCLERMKQTRRHRIGMDAKERAKSVRGAFLVVRPGMVAGRSVLICDDVMTSGSTVGEVARCLARSGATRVSAFTIARAVIRPAG
jgi:ComF family protein